MRRKAQENAGKLNRQARDAREGRREKPHRQGRAGRKGAIVNSTPRVRGAAPIVSQAHCPLESSLAPSRSLGVNASPVNIHGPWRDPRQSHRLVPIRHENQGVCVWAVELDGSDNPPVWVDVDSNGRRGTPWRQVFRSTCTRAFGTIERFSVEPRLFRGRTAR